MRRICDGAAAKKDEILKALTISGPARRVIARCRHCGSKRIDL